MQCWGLGWFLQVRLTSRLACLAAAFLAFLAPFAVREACGQSFPVAPPPPIPEGAAVESKLETAQPAVPELTPDPSVEQPVPPEVQTFIRELVLVLLPPKFDDEDGWGDEKRIQSGLDIDFDDGKIKTHRRWKSVNHGSWIRASGSLVEPEKTMTLRIFRRMGAVPTEQIYRIQLLARANVSGTQQQWNHGVMFWSVSADAEADIQIDVNLRVRTDVVAKEGGGSSLQIQPEVTHAVMRLNGFALKRFSHVRGGMAREFGEAFEGIVRMAVDRQNKKLPKQINKALAKQKDKLQIPVDPGSLFDYFKDDAK